LASAAVGDVVATLQAAGRRYLIVIETVDGQPVLRGVFSASGIEQSLGTSLQVSPRSRKALPSCIRRCSIPEPSGSRRAAQCSTATAGRHQWSPACMTRTMRPALADLRVSAALTINPFEPETS
jgi:hypothetical protein